MHNDRDVHAVVAMGSLRGAMSDFVSAGLVSIDGDAGLGVFCLEVKLHLVTAVATVASPLLLVMAVNVHRILPVCFELRFESLVRTGLPDRRREPARAQLARNQRINVSTMNKNEWSLSSRTDLEALDPSAVLRLHPHLKHGCSNLHK